MRRTCRALGEQLAQGQTANAADPLGDEGQSAIEYPSLIYDGPFSDGRTDGKTLGLTGERLARQQAREAAARYAGVTASQVTDAADSGGRFEAFGFTADTPDGKIAVQVTGQGGHLLWMMPEQAAFTARYSQEECLQTGAGLSCRRGLWTDGALLCSAVRRHGGGKLRGGAGRGDALSRSGQGAGQHGNRQGGRRGVLAIPVQPYDSNGCGAEHHRKTGGRHGFSQADHSHSKALRDSRRKRASRFAGDSSAPRGTTDIGRLSVPKQAKWSSFCGSLKRRRVKP